MPEHGSPLDTQPGRASLALVVLYLALTAAPIGHYGILTGDWLPALLHILALGVAGAALRGLLPASARYWTPLALGPFMYVELRWVIAGAGRPHMDALVAGWDATAFSGLSPIASAKPTDSLLLSELLHLCYLS